MLGHRSKKMNAIRKQRVRRVRAKVHGTAARPRLAVFRSLKHISAQLIDDDARATLVSVRDTDAGKVTGIKAAAAVGALVAERALAKQITAAVFDRRWYQYHGRVKALAEAAREKGLTL